MNMTKEFTKDNIEAEIYTVEVIERRIYRFRAESRKDAKEMIANNLFDKEDVVESAAKLLPATLKVVGYAVKNGDE